MDVVRSSKGLRKGGLARRREQGRKGTRRVYARVRKDAEPAKNEAGASEGRQRRVHMGHEKAWVYSKTFKTVPKESYSSKKAGAHHVGLHAVVKKLTSLFFITAIDTHDT